MTIHESSHDEILWAHDTFNLNLAFIYLHKDFVFVAQASVIDVSLHVELCLQELLEFLQFVIFRNQENRVLVEVRSLIDIKLIKNFSILLADVNPTLDSGYLIVKYFLKIKLRFLVQENLLNSCVCRKLIFLVHYMLQINVKLVLLAELSQLVSFVAITIQHKNQLGHRLHQKKLKFDSVDSCFKRYVGYLTFKTHIYFLATVFKLLSINSLQLFKSVVNFNMDFLLVNQRLSLQYLGPNLGNIIVIICFSDLKKWFRVQSIQTQLWSWLRQLETSKWLCVERFL